MHLAAFTTEPQFRTVSAVHTKFVKALVASVTATIVWHSTYAIDLKTSVLTILDLHSRSSVEENSYVWLVTRIPVGVMVVLPF